MKILFAMMMVMTGPAYAGGDDLTKELACEAVVPREMSDFSLRVELFSNPYAWAKLVRVYESGYLGERLVANVNLPLRPEPAGERLAYAARGLRLEVPAQGEGEGWLVLIRDGDQAGYELRCGTVGGDRAESLLTTK